MILSYYDLGDIFYSCCTKVSLRKLQKLQNSALRCIYNSSIDPNLVELHRKANVHFLENCMKINLCAIAHKRGIPQFSVNKPTSENLRSRYKLNLNAASVNNQCYEKCFLNCGIVLWNSLSEFLKTTPQLETKSK